MSKNGFTDDEYQSHLKAMGLNASYRGHWYEQRLLDALKCPDVGGGDTADLYISKRHPYLGEITREILAADLTIENSCYCANFRDGLSIEVKTSSSGTINAAPISGFLVREIGKLEAGQKKQAVRFKRDTQARDGVEPRDGWMLDVKRRWADIYIFIFVDANGVEKQVLLVPTFLLERKMSLTSPTGKKTAKRKVVSRPARGVLNAKFSTEPWQEYLAKMDWSSNESIMGCIHTALKMLVAKYASEILKYKKERDIDKKRSKITGRGVLYIRKEY